MNAPTTETTVVLQLRDGDIALLRSVQGISVQIINYDGVEEARDRAPADEPPLPVDAAGDAYVSSCPPVYCAECDDWIGDDEPRVSMGRGAAALSYCLRCTTQEAPPMSATTPENTPVACEVEAHAPVIAGLRARGVTAFEEATGGNNYHVCYPHPSGGHILADANEGGWIAGVYVKPAGADEADDGWRWEPAAMLDADLPDDADPALVVAWLLENVR